MYKAKHRKQLGNKFVLRENYIKEEYFEDGIKEVINQLKREYGNCVIEVKRNKHGARVIAYERYS